MTRQSIFGEHVERHALKPLRKLASRLPVKHANSPPKLPRRAQPVVVNGTQDDLMPQNLTAKQIAGKKGYLCLKIPRGKPPILRLSPDDDAASEAITDVDAPSPLLAHFQQGSVKTKGAKQPMEECGGSPADTTLLFLMYHKMGTVWWQHVLRVLCFTTGAYVFEVGFGDEDGMKFLSAAAAAASADKSVNHFPSIIFMDNPATHNVKKVWHYARQAGRVTKLLLQVRDFRDVLVSGYSYHRNHQMSDATAESWMHKPQKWWGEALGRNDSVSYQAALHMLPLKAGAALEMDMVEEIWRSIIMTSHEADLGPSTAYVTYEAMWHHAANLLPKIAQFLYGDITCNPAGMQLVRAALSYTAGFRKVTAAAAAAAEAGSSFSATEVDISEMVNVLEASDIPAESKGSRAELHAFFTSTFVNAGQHFRRGSPGNWKISSVFSPEVAHLFYSRFQCLLQAYGYEEDMSWLPSLPSITKEGTYNQSSTSP